MIDNQVFPNTQRTIITGCVRSGTTQALRVYCRNLTSQEEHHNSQVNEPGNISDAVRSGNIDLAQQCISESFSNRHNLIKSPFAAFVLPHLEPSYRVIVTFRDFRLIVPSMLSHSNVRKYLLPFPMFWEKYLGTDMPSDMLDRAISLAEGFYRNIFEYQGPIELWNYGFWDEWEVRNKRISHLYARGERETSKRVLREMKKGKIFSDRSFNLSIWENFITESKCTKQQQDFICAANERIRSLFKKRGLAIRTLDDLETLSPPKRRKFRLRFR